MRSLWQKYVFPLCIIGQFIVNITFDKHNIGEIPTLNVTINIKGKVKCLIFTLSLIQIVKLQTFSLGKIVQNHSISIKWNSFAWQIFDNYGREGEMKLCGVMKSVVTLLIKVVHISTNSSQSPPIWEEIMTWLSPSLNLRISESELLFSLQHVLTQRPKNIWTSSQWYMRIPSEQK